MNNKFINVTLASPKLEIGNPSFNVKEILSVLKQTKSDLTVFPELALTGYSCKDLFFQAELLEDNLKALEELVSKNPYDGLIIIGLPYSVNNQLIDLALVIHKDKILGAIPKFNLANTKGAYEKRWFKSGYDLINQYDYIDVINQVVPFGNLLFSNKDVNFTVEINQDITDFNPLKSIANFTVNIAANTDEVGFYDKQRSLVKSDSIRHNNGYLFTSSGVSESSSDGIFKAMHFAYENGEMILEKSGLQLESYINEAILDLGKLDYYKRLNQNDMNLDLYQEVNIPEFTNNNFEYYLNLSKTPFIPEDKPYQTFKEITSIQKFSLIKRLNHLRLDRVIIGISGGADSTLALLIACAAFDELKISRKNIYAYTLPGLHTSDSTKSNALDLMEALGVSVNTIDLNDHIKDHLRLIDHDLKEDVTYENSQARMRTNILMNLANKYNALFIGTGDLSEISIGWATYNGDQMSMYNTNAGVPKTTVKFLIENFGKYIYDEKITNILWKIIETPISPELKSNQSTEESVGKYEINDFILYRFINCGDKKSRIFTMLKDVFGLSDTESQKYVDGFFKRFYAAQYKRQASSDGPKVFAFGLKANSDFLMSADVKRK
ncbi:MAG: NAD(+) synthase [Candidatus Izimaplasma sp.]|nr:NAD(+) synthase [Candidatus Izimaplasma bacterium]